MSTQYYLSGTASTRRDTKRTLAVKRLSVYQRAASANPANNPHPHNTVRELKVKILKAIDGL